MINKDLEKHVFNHKNEILLKPVGKREDLVIKAVCDASFHQLSKAVRGEILMIGNKENDKICPIFWKSRSIAKTCKSAKDAETRALGKCVDDGVYSAKRIERMLFGDVKNRIKVIVNTDSEPLIETIGSTKGIENRNLYHEVAGCKESILNGTVVSYGYISTKENPADKLTKNSQETKKFIDIFENGRYLHKPRKYVKLVVRETAREIRTFVDEEVVETDDFHEMNIMNNHYWPMYVWNSENSG